MDCVELIIWKNDKETHFSNLEHVLLENTVGPCLVRQSVQKAKSSTLCKFALCKCLSSLSDLKKIPHYANFFRFFLIFRTMQDYIRILKKAALCKSALSKSALNKDLLYNLHTHLG